MRWILPLIVWMSAAVPLAGPRAATAEPNADRQAHTAAGLGAELHAARAENPVSHQRFIWAAQEAVSASLDDRTSAEVLEGLSHGGFHLHQSATSGDSQLLRASLPEIDYPLGGGRSLTLELFFEAAPEVSRTAPTRILVRRPTVRLFDAVKLPYAQLRESERYPKGSILNSFFAEVKPPPEVDRYPEVESVSLEVIGPSYYVSEETFPGDYRPCQYLISLDLIRREGSRVYSLSLIYRCSNGLAPNRSRTGEVQPGPFVPRDVFGPFSRLPGGATGEPAPGAGGVFRRGPARRHADSTAARVYSIADLRALDAGTTAIQLRGQELRGKDLAELRRFKKLVSLDYRGDNWPSGPAIGLGWMLELPRLRQISMAGSAVNDRTCAIVSRVRSLREVSISSGAITDVGVRRLLRLPHLERLRLPYCKGITDDSLRRIGRVTRLREVKLASNSGVTGTGIRALGRLRYLEVLQVGNVTGALSTDFAFLPRLSRLRELSLTYMPLGDQALSYVAKLPRLESLDLIDLRLITDTGIRQLHTLHNTWWLAISYSPRITEKGLEALRAELPAGTRLN